MTSWDMKIANIAEKIDNTNMGCSFCLDRVVFPLSFYSVK